MAKISETKGRSDANSGYARLFGNQLLGQLMSRVHATVIRTGNELEHIIEAETPAHLKTTLDTILGQQEVFASEIQVVFQGRMPGTAGQTGGTIDVAVFDHQNRKVLVIELKDGDTFDTKKSSGELESMTKFADWIGRKTGYNTTFYFCSFNQDNKEAIVRGAKGRFDINHAMTGRELCVTLGIDYVTIQKRRQNQQSENLRYFLSELLKISEIRRLIQELLNKS
ncbi:MAG: restriction endonuclease [Thioploca sp.]|nr:restriction endonuclease [Thioploca sp.]